MYVCYLALHEGKVSLLISSDGRCFTARSEVLPKIRLLLFRRN